MGGRETIGKLKVSVHFARLCYMFAVIQLLYVLLVTGWCCVYSLILNLVLRVLLETLSLVTIASPELT